MPILETRTLSINLESLDPDSNRIVFTDILDAYKYELDLVSLGHLAVAAESIPEDQVAAHQLLNQMAYERLLEGLAISLAYVPKQKITTELNLSSLQTPLTMRQWASKCCGIELPETAITSLLEIATVQIINAGKNGLYAEIAHGPIEKNKSTEMIEFIYHETLKNNADYTINLRDEIIVTIHKKNYNLTYLLGEADLSQLSISPNDEITEVEKIAIQKFTQSDYVELNYLLRNGKLLNHESNPKTIFLQTCSVSYALIKLTDPRQVDLLHKFEKTVDSYIQSKGGIEVFEAAFEKTIELSADVIASKDQKNKVDVYSQLMHEYISNHYLADLCEHACNGLKIMTPRDWNYFVEFHVIGSLRKTDYVPSISDDVTSAPSFNEGFMSFSKAKTQPFFAHKKFTIWSRYGTSIRHLSAEDPEAETLGHPGQTFFFQQLSPTLFHATPIHAADLQKPRDYTWMQAVQVAYDTRLRNPYTETELCADDIKLGDIERPNHGLAHTMRKIHYVDAVIAFFAKHASDKVERAIYENLTLDERNKIKATLAFYVSGRESEVSWKSNLEAVQRYKKNASKYFTYFAKHHTNWGTDTIKKYAQFLQRCAPQKPKLKCLNTIIDLCHQLDLARCYEPVAIQDSVERHLPQFSVSSAEMKKDWIELLKWSTECIRVTGDRLAATVNDEGRYIKQNTTGYAYHTFKIASTSPLDSIALLRQVKPLSFTHETPCFPHFQQQTDLKKDGSDEATFHSYSLDELKLFCPEKLTSAIQSFYDSNLLSDAYIILNEMLCHITKLNPNIIYTIYTSIKCAFDYNEKIDLFNTLKEQLVDCKDQDNLTHLQKDLIIKIQLLWEIIQADVKAEKSEDQSDLSDYQKVLLDMDFDILPDPPNFPSFKL